MDAGKLVPGGLDHASGAVTFDDPANPKGDDLLDDLAEFVLRRGGEVVVAPSDRMPTRSGAAAISPDALGFGDVKLLGLLGLVLGWFGWGVLLTGVFLGLLAGAVTSLALLATRRAGWYARSP